MARKKKQAIDELRAVMSRLRAPDGCPWDQEQDHRSIRLNAVEEVYELVDAIEAGDDEEMLEELGDLLLQVVFHAQMADERGAFDFDDIAQTITDKLIRRCSISTSAHQHHLLPFITLRPPGSLPKPLIE